ncbi:glutaminyl transferase [Natrinema thermotolerans]|uniref:Glutaminyl transferase n=1 Tax=Natrinema thermotolerans TaxID=121872 RepID=A0AAF0T0R3_9EURY|nr:aspartyl protease family protein [Natrinema thermotolerans]ELZ09635.1 glutaminyl transferase, lysine biosynthesis regulator/ribosomal protein S6 modification enzyme [Natrinema thermotolerans DSM 11552]QCC60269.1 glutaminyl transferase [Natrinema thermotolerans]QCC61180.1 glutaminyl transferase [Natrinema thermotolerans]WMT07290.1 glutaminyl transferase [Natrinema thermotolerans]
MTEPAKPVVGRLETVAVSGTDATETVVAKADTGADRTTIDETLLERIGSTGAIDDVTVRSGGSAESRDIVAISVDVRSVDRGPRVVLADVDDRQPYTGEVLLGSDLLDGFYVDCELQNTTVNAD